MPEHKHPHGVANLQPHDYRVWVCTECLHVFTDEEIRKDTDVSGDASVGGWGHSCKSHPCRKGQRCESHLEPYMPDRKVGMQP